MLVIFILSFLICIQFITQWDEYSVTQVSQPIDKATSDLNIVI